MTSFHSAIHTEKLIVAEWRHCGFTEESEAMKTTQLVLPRIWVTNPRLFLLCHASLFLFHVLIQKFRRAATALALSVSNTAGNAMLWPQLIGSKVAICPGLTQIHSLSFWLPTGLSPRYLESALEKIGQFYLQVLSLYGNVYQQWMNSPEDGFLRARKTNNGTDVHGAIEISGESQKRETSTKSSSFDFCWLSRYHLFFIVMPNLNLCPWVLWATFDLIQQTPFYLSKLSKFPML